MYVSNTTPSISNTTGALVVGGGVGIGGDINASNGTFTTITGQTEVLRGTGTNFITYSEQFNNAAWTKASSSVSADTSVAPNGTTTADTITFTGGGTLSRVIQNCGATTGVTYTQSWYVKLGTQNYVQLLWGGSSFSTAFYANFDISLGTVPFVGSGASAAITSVGSGWYRISLTSAATATSASDLNCQLCAIDSTAAGRAANLTASNTTIIAWGAQVEIASSVGTYLQTTTTAIYGTPTLSFSGVAGLSLASNGSLYVSPAGTSSTNVTSSLAIGSGSANYLQVTGNTTGNGPILSAQGTDANVSMNIVTKGTNNGPSINFMPGGNTQIQILNAGDGTRSLQFFGGSAGGVTAPGLYVPTGVMTYTTNGNGHNFYTGGWSAGASSVSQFRITHTASAVNYLQVTGAATANYPTIQAQGSDGAVGLIFKTQGNPTGPGIQFVDGAGQINFGIRTSVASAVNYIQVQANPTGQGPVVNSAGPDANIDLNLVTFGSGNINFRTQSTSNNYVQFRVSDTIGAVNYLQSTGNTTGNAVTISAQGADANVSMQLLPKSTGSVLVKQTYSQGTGAVQVTGGIAASGNTVSQNMYVAGNNNLLTYSQDFSQGTAWTNTTSNLAFSFANTTAPDGTFTGTFVYEDATGVNHYTARNVTPVLGIGSLYTYSIFAKAAQRNIVYLQSTSGSATYPKTYFNLSTGTIALLGTGHTASITAVGGGWYRCSITFVSDISNNPSITIIGIAATAGTSAYVGDGTSGLYVWGAQIEQAATASPYTFTGAGTVSNPNNLYVPNAIAIGTTSPNSALHIVQTAGTGPGGYPAITLDVPNVAGGYSAAGINMRVNGGQGYTLSAITYDWYGSVYQGAGTVGSHGIQYVSGRSGLANHIFRNSSNVAQAIITDVSQGGINYNSPTSGTILSGQYVAGQSWLLGGTANLQVTGNTIANGVATIQNIVVQGQNNLLTYSQDYTNSAWTKQNVVVTATSSQSADGNNASQTFTANNAGQYCAVYRTTPVATVNGYWTFSIYIQNSSVNPGSSVTINFGPAYANGNFSSNSTWTFPASGLAPTATFVATTGTGIVSNTTTETRLSGMYRCTVTSLIYDTQATQLRTDIIIPSTAGANSVLIWGSQLEQGQQPSNYTYTAATPASTNNNIYIPSGNVQATNSIVSNKLNWVNSNNSSVVYQTYNSSTNSLDIVFG